MELMTSFLLHYTLSFSHLSLNVFLVKRFDEFYFVSYYTNQNL